MVEGPIPKKPALLLLDRGYLKGVRVMPAAWERFCFFREMASEGSWDAGEIASARLVAELRASFASANGVRGARAVSEAEERGAPLAFFDDRLRISYVVDAAQRCLRSVAMTDMHRSLRLPHPRFGPVGVTFHAWERFRERYPKAVRISEMLPVETLARTMRDSYARAKHEVLDFSTTAMRRTLHPTAGEVRYFRDRTSGLRYVVMESKALVLTVEIPSDRADNRADAIPPSWHDE